MKTAEACFHERSGGRPTSSPRNPNYSTIILADLTGRQLSQSQLDRVLIHLDISQKGPDQGDILGARRAIEQVEQAGHIEPFIDGQPAQRSLMIGTDDAELTTEPEDILDRVKQSPESDLTSASLR